MYYTYFLKAGFPTEPPCMARDNPAYLDIYFDAGW